MPYEPTVSRERLTVIKRDGPMTGYLRECWEHREVMRFFARRDFVVRYRQTFVGIGWVLIKPLLGMAIFTVVFGHIAKLPAEGAPYPLLVLTGMVLWQFFSAVVNECSISVSNNPNLITKVYFPRILLPASTVALNLLDLMTNVLLLAAVLLWYGILPPARVALAPCAVVLAAMPALGLGLWLSALMVRYRDVKNIVPVALQFGLIASPVAYTSFVASSDLQRLLWLNPLGGAIDLLRWCVLPGAHPPATEGVIMSVLIGSFLMVTGYAYFRRAEASFADAI